MADVSACCRPHLLPPSQADVVVVIENSGSLARGERELPQRWNGPPLALPSRKGELALQGPSSRDALRSAISRQAAKSDSIAVMPRLM